jgi:hypothetical protein
MGLEVMVTLRLVNDRTDPIQHSRIKKRGHPEGQNTRA